MDFKRLMWAFVLSFAIMMTWEYFFPTPKPQPQTAATSSVAQQSNNQNVLGAISPITVQTDSVKAIIDEKTGDLRHLTLLQYDATEDSSKQFVLLDQSQAKTYVAQSDLVDANGNSLLKNLSFSASQKSYQLNGDKLEVRLSAPEQNGLQINKIYTFTKGSYLINVRFEVRNNGAQTANVGSAYHVVRDNHTPEGQGWFMYSYTGPVVYTPDADEFQKVDFGDLDDDFKTGKDTAEYQRKATGGYVGMIQHYFATTWLAQTHQADSNICTAGCNISVKKRADNLYSASVNTPAVNIASGATQSFAANLYAGPQVTSTLRGIAPSLELVKDYGRVHIFAAPLFLLLDTLHKWVHNWGWAIVLLTLIVKAILFPLNQKAYKSMAKMRTIAPKMEALKKQYANDQMGMQQAMMKLYKDEQINPLGGCLPMLLQMPIFIGLYWMIFLSVELRQAPWLGWITDLSRADPFFILPLLMAATMWFQTKLSPPPSDPMQAQMMKIMPLVFSIMFFFFPAGLVLYYVVNNLLTIAQQWYINRNLEQATQNGVVLDKVTTKTKKK